MGKKITSMNLKLNCLYKVLKEKKKKHISLLDTSILICFTHTKHNPEILNINKHTVSLKQRRWIANKTKWTQKE